MGLANKIKILLAANSVRSFAELGINIDKTNKDLRKKVKSGDPSDISFDDFNFLKDKHMSKALKQLKAIFKTAKMVNSTKFELPEIAFKKLEQNAIDNIKKKGPEHKDSAATVDKYHKALAFTIVNMTASNKQMKTYVKEIERRIKNAELLRNYTGTLNKELLKIAKFAVLTAMQAQFFVLSQEAMALKKKVTDIHSTYKSVLKNAKAAIKECEAEIFDLKTRAKFVSDGGLQFQFGEGAKK